MKAAVEAPVLNSDRVAKGFADHQFKHPWEEFVEHSGHLHFNGAMVPARWERIKHRNELTVAHNAKNLCVLTVELMRGGEWVPQYQDSLHQLLHF